MEKVRFVMVRLKRPTFMRDVVDNDLPVRFLFIVFGPPLLDVCYHELGRALATVMANRVRGAGKWRTGCCT